MPAVQEQFIFNHSFDELHPLLNRILSVIEKHCASEKNARLRANCRLVLMEMFTNALKHANVPTTDIGLLINDKQIKISKSDKGKVFFLPAFDDELAVEFPFHSDLTGKKVTIFRDDICSLSATLHSVNKLVFAAEQNEADTLPAFPDLHEHYGLMIITRAADEFVYFYDADERTNVFSATLKV